MERLMEMQRKFNFKIKNQKTRENGSFFVAKILILYLAFKITHTTKNLSSWRQLNFQEQLK